MDAATRKAVTDAAVLAARAVNYVGAGTIEFIADASQGLHPDRIWFMELLYLFVFTQFRAQNRCTLLLELL